MTSPKRIDLHTHSTVSDGTDTPGELLAHVREAGIGLFSLTDHDTVKGCLRIRGILGGGGIPVLAHPILGSGDQCIRGGEMEQRLRRLTGFGLQGVEAFCSGFPREYREEMLSFAERFGLYVTAGSDYHGRNKPVALGDTGLGEPESWPEGLRRFLADTGA